MICDLLVADALPHPVAKMAVSRRCSRLRGRGEPRDGTVLLDSMMEQNGGGSGFGLTGIWDQGMAKGELRAHE